MTCTTFAKLRKAAVSAALLASSFVLTLTASAHAGPALLLDAGTGRVLYEEQAGEPWYPASVTKLMTTYLVLKEVQEGRLSLDSPLTVSVNAAKTQPSKMGFLPGTVLTIDNALKMMLVKSANDLAVVLAEGVAGSVDGFAAAMNVEARRLGMNTSYFTNPHGLPDPRQRVSARDLAILAQALLHDFPQYRSYYGIGGVQLGDKIYQNTNGLIGRYPGAEGMKTGFICASGFNVVATATRGNQQLIVVLLGERNATARTIRAAQLFDMGFSGRLTGTRQLEEIPFVSEGTAPDIREMVCGKNRNNLADDDNAPVHASAGDDSSALAFLTSASQPAFTRIAGDRPGTLIKRAEMAPVPVFTLLTPKVQVVAKPAANSSNAKTAMGKTSAGKTSLGKKTGTAKLPDTAKAFVATEATPAGLSGSAPVVLQRVIKPRPDKKNASKTTTTKSATGKQAATKQSAASKGKAKSQMPPPRQ
ncbi:D-alanyl-D-alanine carboxypeptidase family protein [Pseudochelatococcus sp. G4_1912]|uniref:D-alanyl-D-alanine carboxypeptidase family protein n=1 Tax=Pseudochelatococcus sp. G4_1912 TaxID=3114288 RepID=UPI0039C6987A